MKRLRVSRSARGDLVDIWTYIAVDDAIRADAFLDEFHAKFQTLAGSPEIGRRRDELRRGIRSIPHGNYLVFYTASAEYVDIVRVLSGYRDIEKLFEE